MFGSYHVKASGGLTNGFNSRINDRFNYFIMYFLQLQGLCKCKYFTLENKFICVIVLNGAGTSMPLKTLGTELKLPKVCT